MALYSLIFNKPELASFETMVGTEKVVVPIDASMSESHMRQSQITQSPIEDGTNIADHVILMPEKLDLEGIISDTPLNLTTAGIGLAASSASQLASSQVQQLLGNSPIGAAVGDLAGSGIGSLAKLITGQPRNPKDAFNYLEELWRSRQPFTMVTALKKYDNMIITSLSVPRTAQIGNSIRFNISMEQIRITQSALVDVPAFKVQPKAGGQSNADLGQQAAKEAEEGIKTQSSILLKSFKSIKSTFTDALGL